MGNVIITNYDAMVARAALDVSARNKSTAIQRLATGFRINTARDDAAGLAIADFMESQVRGLTQARRNGNDGVSLAQTAEGALTGTTSALKRIRELTVQALNTALYTPENRSAMQLEVAQNILEINRISEQTAFNGLELLNTALNTVTFQIGAMDSQNISVVLNKMDAASLKLPGTAIDVSSIDIAQDATTLLGSSYLSLIDAAVTQVNTLRAELGAVQNRFTAIVSSLDAAINNTAASLSGIRDTDYAAETTAFASASVIQQAGIAVLAQANQQPQLLLSLLPR